MKVKVLHDVYALDERIWTAGQIVVVGDAVGQMMVSGHPDLFEQVGPVDGPGGVDRRLRGGLHR